MHGAAVFTVQGPWRLPGDAMLGATIAQARGVAPNVYVTEQNVTLPHLAVPWGPKVREVRTPSRGKVGCVRSADTGEIRHDGALKSWRAALDGGAGFMDTRTIH